MGWPGLLLQEIAALAPGRAHWPLIQKLLGKEMK
jgi:hypothetical protein